MNPLLIKAGIVIGGGILGYVYYKLVGCRTGTCPLTSSPFGSVFMGALIALLFVNR